MPNKYKQVLVESKVTEDDAFVTKDIEAILSKHFDENNTKDVYKLLFNCIDLTALNSTDTVESIGKMVERVNAFETDYPELKNVAAVCVYPNFAMVVSGGLEVSDVDTAVVAGSFPSSQTFLEVKTAETALAVADGANEVDIVLNLGLFYSNNYEELTDEIAELKHAARNARRGPGVPHDAAEDRPQGKQQKPAAHEGGHVAHVAHVDALERVHAVGEDDDQRRRHRDDGHVPAAPDEQHDCDDGEQKSDDADHEGLRS